MCGVEVWRGGLGGTYRLPSLSFVSASLVLACFRFGTLADLPHPAEFLKLGIRYQEVTFGAGTRLDLFGNLKHLLIQRKFQILDKPELLRQLRSLEEHKTVRGNIEVRSFAGAFHEIRLDDLLARSVVLFGAFIPFFGFRELGRVIGPEKVRALFFKKRDAAKAETPAGV